MGTSYCTYTDKVLPVAGPVFSASANMLVYGERAGEWSGAALMWRGIVWGLSVILARGHFSLCPAMWSPRVWCDVASMQPAGKG